jgi:hypothetical protein
MDTLGQEKDEQEEKMGGKKDIRSPRKDRRLKMWVGAEVPLPLGEKMEEPPSGSNPGGGASSIWPDPRESRISGCCGPGYPHNVDVAEIGGSSLECSLCSSRNCSRDRGLHSSLQWTW